MKRCSVIEAPSTLGLRSSGVDELPDALRAAGFLVGLPDVQFVGRLEVPSKSPRPSGPSGVLNAEGIVGFALELADHVTFTLDQGRFPVVLGGDCSILLGPALALRRRGRFGLFFLDGHADFYTPESESTGEAASMDLALVTGHGPEELANIEGRSPLVREVDTVVFGFRDAAIAADEGSPDVRNTAMHVYDLAEVYRWGVAEAARTGLTTLEANGIDGFWIHLDADILSDEIMPAVDYRMAGGLLSDELTAVLSVLLSSPKAMGMDVTIYNPTLDDDEQSAARTLAQAITRSFVNVT